MVIASLLAGRVTGRTVDHIHGVAVEGPIAPIDGRFHRHICNVAERSVDRIGRLEGGEHNHCVLDVLASNCFCSTRITNKHARSGSRTAAQTMQPELFVLLLAIAVLVVCTLVGCFGETSRADTTAMDLLMLFVLPYCAIWVGTVCGFILLHKRGVVGAAPNPWTGVRMGIAVGLFCFVYWFGWALLRAKESDARGGAATTGSFGLVVSSIVGPLVALLMRPFLQYLWAQIPKTRYQVVAVWLLSSLLLSRIPYTKIQTMPTPLLDLERNQLPHLRRFRPSQLRRPLPRRQPLTQA